MRRIKIFEIIEVIEDNGTRNYFYKGGEMDGQPFHTQPIGGKIVTPAHKPEDIRRIREEKKIEKISSVGSILKSHREEDNLPEEGV